MSSSFIPPQKIRDQLVSELFIQTAILNPDRTFAHVIDGDVAHPVVESITWSQLLAHAHSISKELSNWVQPQESGLAPRTLGLLARNGYSYAVHLLAVLLNGWTATSISIKNSPSAIDHLLHTSGAEYLLTDQDSRPLTVGCSFKIPVLEFRNLSTLPFHGMPSPKSVTPEALDQAVRQTAFYFHTSGSTGHPKVIPWTHQFFGQIVTLYLPDVEGYHGHPIYCLAPIYHAMGTIFSLASALIVGSPLIFVETRKPITGEALVRHLRPFSEVIVVAVPSILQEVAEAGEAVIKEFASRVKAVFVGGAAFDVAAGDLLSAYGVAIQTVYGMTEINMAGRQTVPKSPQGNGEWRYVQWRDGYKPHLIPIEGSNAKELIIEPAEDSPAVIDHDNLRGFRTRDTWLEHPIRPGWWVHAGRLDDITVLSNGEKTNNKQLEIILLRDRRIRNVVVFGEGRLQNGILVDPVTDIQDPQSFINDIWPTVVAMNQEVPSHSRLVRELILVADPDRPFAFTDKRTVRGKTTLALYKKEIDAAYKNLEGSESPEWEIPRTFDAQSIQTFIATVVRSVLAREVNETEDLFAQGMDSLLAVRIRSSLLPLIKASPQLALDLPRNVVYTYPTVSSLAAFLSAKLDPSSEAPAVSEHDKARDLIKKYSEGLNPHSPDVTQNVRSGSVVAVTGTTGSVGSFLVDRLLRDPEIDKIYCLNRKSSKKTTERQTGAFQDRGLDHSLLETMPDRLRFIDVDLSQSNLGLSEVDYDELRNNITHLIHTAWHLNFNLSVESFEKPHIAGVRHLIDLVLSSPRPVCPRFVFLSSISAVSEYKEAPEVPEVPLDNPSVAKMGYGLAKFVGERIIDNAVRRAGLNGIVVRVGQISGSASASAAWSRTEQYPMMFISGIELGMFPSDLPAARWIPVDVAARVIISQSFHSDARALDYFHLENPEATPWSDVAEVVSGHNGRNIQLVSMKEWLAELKQRSQEPDFDAEKIPAFRLLGFYEEEITMPILGVGRTLQISPELRFGPIARSLITKYLEYLRL
ncbi:acetyl-CoA synthetase-like protein [Sistotremastrum niveocremeum HHB9708]|uniref:Acetyl-CoA synthetase-like protein n=1 Tax=Sistotremastrum niveocremeum HHB9708 TaxID=1314777 RepID=A0A164PYG8_9AGAM|nr:acetyl-CoA synthetase-like protein [Sistotremastrum niveocremeum HHB9708]